MPSPFPGMDPYLEQPAYWRSFHASFVTYCRDALQPQLPLRYYADIDARLLLEETARAYYPDLALKKRAAHRVAEPVAAYKVSVSKEPEPDVILDLDDQPRVTYVAIKDREGDQVVTVIELLSPSNKTPGPDRDRYATKQQDLRRGGVNLVEIDLLRAGSHTVAAPGASLGLMDECDSLISIWRAQYPDRLEVYPVHLRQPLPCIGVPLQPEDADVSLDLQSLFTQCYDNAQYERRIDYQSPPPVPVNEEDAAWLHSLLAEKGLR